MTQSTTHELNGARVAPSAPNISGLPNIVMPGDTGATPIKQSTVALEEVQPVIDATPIAELEVEETTPVFPLDQIFTEALLKVLNPNDLAISVQDFILKYSKLTGVPQWQQEDSALVAVFSFDKAKALDLFLTNTFSIADEFKRIENLSVQVSVADVKATNRTEEIDKIYNKAKAVEEIEADLKLATAVATREAIHSFPYSGDLITKFSQGDDSDFYLKIPVAKIGSWRHPVYDKVEYTSQDLDTIKLNFDNQELGFEPPLYVGHSTGDGTPARGFLTKLEREGDILFGYFSVSKEVYRSVEDKLFRYSSAEIIVDHKSRTTGESVGKTVMGMALTNIPFIPNLPETEPLKRDSIKDVVILSFCQESATEENLINKNKDNKINMDTNTTKMSAAEEALQKQVQAYAEQVKSLELTRKELENSTKLSELKAQVEEYSVKETAWNETQQKLSTVVEQNKELANQLEEYQKEIRQKEADMKIEKLQSLSLPNDFKEVYSNLIKENKLGEIEGIVLSSLESLSASTTSQITDQSGAATATEKLNDPKAEDPYQKEIDRVKALLANRR